MEPTEPLHERLRALITREYNMPYITALSRTLRHLSPIEKVILWVLIAGFTFSAFALAQQVNKEATAEVPVRGGTVKEGVLGAPRFINPLLAQTDTDRDLVMLMYSGLMRPTTNGDLIPDLAERYEISEDGTQYTFILRDNARFHDGTPVTADDVLFTIAAAQDPAIKSARRADWDGVVAEKISTREVRFTLAHPYAPFLENTTIGILPRAVWINVSPQEFPFSTFNTQPIGSGPFKLKHIDYNGAGIPVRYTLVAFNNYALGRPYINTFSMRFYANENDLVRAYEAGTISSVSGISSSRIGEVLKKDSRLLEVAFPRIFAIFFNQNQNHALTDVRVRTALSLLIDKQAIVEDILSGYGTVIDSPLPPETVTNQYSAPYDARTHEERVEEAHALLVKSNWDYNEELAFYSDGEQLLTLTITTANTPELKRAADTAAATWSAAGIPTKVSVFETGELNQNIIRPRDYESLLFGEVVGRSLDLFAFWHSSQKDDPGLNVASYTNSTADSLLSKARATSDKTERDELYVSFEDEVRKDMPAVFLYAPDFLYIVPRSLRNTEATLVATPSERFAQVHTWHTQTERVWNFFIK